MQNFENRFRHHIGRGFQLERALDIGAYRGEFSRLLKKLWPDAKVWMFEADERQKAHNPEAIYALLGDSERECDFYTIDDTENYTTGSSIYIENTVYYRDPIVLKKQMTTIDKLMTTVDFSGNWRDHGLVKLDTQGSELDILEGAKRFIKILEPRLMLLEASVFPYNKGAPLIADVFAYMAKIAYRPVDVFDLQYDSEMNLLQMDVLFESTENPLRP
jgi:FkbM family methyltransferase